MGSNASGGDPFFLAIGERTGFVLGQGDIPLHPLSEYRVEFGSSKILIGTCR
jgi:hypothetical protein